METVEIPAHFDGKHIVLDAPYELTPNASLLVTILPLSDEDIDQEQAWVNAVASNDVFEFLSNPAEDIYTLTDGTPIPPLA